MVDHVEITPEMIEAGAFALIENYSGHQDSAQTAVRKILEAVLPLAPNLTVVKPLNLGPSVSTGKRTPV